MRNTFSNLDASKLLPATKACIAWLDKEIAKGVPKASYANENDKPRDASDSFAPCSVVRTVKGETMGEQTERWGGLSPTEWVSRQLGEPNGGTQNALKSLTPEQAIAAAERMPVMPSEAHRATRANAPRENWREGEQTRLRFKPVLNNLSERKHSHYFKKCPYDVVDVYRVLALFGVTDPCFQHALKKILLAGDRKHKDVEKDVQESIDTLVRWQEMQQEDVAAGLAMLDLMKV
ncbi:hypothetical protein PQR39_35530 [Paraburkholderia sediminicola]|uniref:hypothetical protein n=1 Tax=Paraburkholderia sediminicola TaxID=458836 RepID=UPI0038B9B47C